MVRIIDWIQASEVEAVLIASESFPRVYRRRSAIERALDVMLLCAEWLRDVEHYDTCLHPYVLRYTRMLLRQANIVQHEYARYRRENAEDLNIKVEHEASWETGTYMEEFQPRAVDMHDFLRSVLYAVRKFEDSATLLFDESSKFHDVGLNAERLAILATAVFDCVKSYSSY